MKISFSFFSLFYVDGFIAQTAKRMCTARILRENSYLIKKVKLNFQKQNVQQPSFLKWISRLGLKN